MYSANVLLLTHFVFSQYNILLVKFAEEEKEEMARKKRAVEAKDKGNALYKSKQFTEALSAYDEALEIDPQNVMIRNNKVCHRN